MDRSRFVAPFVLQYSYKRSLGPVLSQFATALRDGRILGAVGSEGRVLVPPVEADPATGASVGRLVEVGPAGTVMSWTWVEEPGDTDPLDRPFGWAAIQLDGASTQLLHAVDVARDALKVGLRVQPRWSDERSGTILDIACFEAVGATVVIHPSEGEPVTCFEAPTRIGYTVFAGAVTADFLEALCEGRLVGRRCPGCQKVYVPPRGSCPTCALAMEEPVEVAQVGTVTAFSVVRIPFEGQRLEPPYACAHVLLDGADVPLLHIVGGCEVDDVEVGMRVEAVWADPIEPTLASIHFFRPVA